MLVGNRMTKHPITIGPDELLSAAKSKMHSGRFRRLPVVSGGDLVGLITERDLREHRGHLDQVKVNGAMITKLITIGPGATLEEAGQIMLKRQIGGLPVVEKGTLIGVITANDIMKAFLDVMGASEPDSTRIDFILEGEEHGLTEASRIVNREGGEILGVGTYREKIGDNPVCYLRLLSGNTEKIVKALRTGGFDVLGIHKIGGELNL
jgi:acetoin utilization protein AcuB